MKKFRAAALRDLLMRLAAHGLIQAKWSEEIHEEWITAILSVAGIMKKHVAFCGLRLLPLHPERF